MGLHFSVINDGRFKVPTLRNIELTTPYMHDGRFKTLEEVIDFYNEQIKNSRNLSWKLQDYEGNPMRLGLNQKEKEALVAFLKTLTEEEFIRNEYYSDPFQE